MIQIELSPVELHYYNDTLDRLREALHIPLDGSARSSDWILDGRLLRAGLLHLRQICTHVQVGQLQTATATGAKVDRLRLGNQLMTMSEALERIKTDHTQEFVLESRAQVSDSWVSEQRPALMFGQMRFMIEKAQLLMLREDDGLRFHNARLVNSDRHAPADLLSAVRKGPWDNRQAIAASSSTP